MAQTTDKIRVVEGTQAKYDASPSTWSNDIYFATDTRKIYARGTPYGAIDDGIWYTLTPYVYDGSSTLYYYIKIAQLNDGYSGHFRTLEFDVHDDANYATGARYWLNLNVYSSDIKNAALISTTIVGSGMRSATMTVYLDTSGAVWVRFPDVDWSNRVRVRKVFEYAGSNGDIDESIPFYSNPSKQTTAPSNLSSVVEYSGGIRLIGSDGTFEYTDAHIYAIAEEADTVDGYHASDIMTFKRQTGLNANNLTGIGVKETQGGTNMPSSNSWHQVMTWGTADTGYGFQFANKYTRGSTFYFRQKTEGAWKPWYEVIHAANYTNFTVTKTGSGASGTWGINISGSAVSLTATNTNSDLNSIRTDGRLYYGIVGNTATNKPSGVHAFGMLSMRTAHGWYGQLLMSSDTSTGLYWRTAQTYSGGWRKVLDSSNYTEYAASKSVATTSANGLMSSTDKQNLNLLASNGITGISWSGATMSWEKLSSQAGSYTIPNATTSSSGLMSASDKSKLDKGLAGYTHGGALTCNRGFSKNDNHGWPVYVLIADCTSTVNASASGAQKGFTGIIIRKRTSGYVNETVAHVIARIGYASSSYTLKSTQSSVKPCILKNGDKYYIALRLTGSGGEVYMYGYEVGLLSTFTQVNTADSDGTLPEGYSVYVNGTDYYGRADYAASTYSASVLSNSRTLWGQPFNGSGNVSGNMSGVGTVTLSNGCNIHPDGARIIIQKDSTSAVIIDANTFRRINTATAMALGSSTYRWAGIYSTGGNFNAELVNTSENGLRLANDSKSVILRKDSSKFHLLIADSTATGSNWNNLRPFYFNLTTGKVNMQNGVAISSGLSVSGAASFNAAVTGATEYTTAKGDGSRFAKMVPGAFRLMAATTGWANELNAFTNDGSTRLACIAGAYGEGDNVEYLYYGGTDYNAPVMVIKGRYVGIGTKSPAYPLHVVGRIKQSGGECQFSVGEYTDPWKNTSCAIKASGNVGIGGQLKVTGTVTAPTFSGNASSATVASVLKHNGSSPPSEGKPSQTGMQLFGAYNNGYPYAYGNVLRIKGTGSGGSSELLLGWSGTTNGVEHIYYRNNRDNASTWSEWRQIAFTTDIEHYTLPAATNTVLGGVKLFSATVQSVAANAVSATSGRTYGVQKNSSGQLVVNVPWVNTTYGLASNTANGLMSNGQKQNLDILVANALTGLAWIGGKLQYERIPGSTGTVTIPNATTGANGLMSASDKAKLDGIASGANKYTLPAASTSAIGGVKTNGSGKWWNGGVPTVGTDGVMEVGKYTDYHYTNAMTADYSVRVSCPNVVGVTVTLPSQAGTLLVDIPATTSKNGSMSAADKQKLEALHQYIGELERMQYHSLRIPYRMWYDASTSANTTVTFAMLAGTQWGSVSEFATWLKNFCLHGGSVTLERSDPDSSAPRVQSCIWRYIGSATGWRLIVEYQGSFSSGAGTHNAFDEALFIQFNPDGGTVEVRRYT